MWAHDAGKPTSWNRDNMNNYKAIHGQDDNPHGVVNIKSQQNLNDYKQANRCENSTN